MKAFVSFFVMLMLFVSVVLADDESRYELILTGVAAPPEGITFQPEQFKVWLATASETYPANVSFGEGLQFTARFPKAPEGKYTLYLGVFELAENAQIAKAFRHGFEVKSETQSSIDLGEVAMVKKSFLPNGSPAPHFEGKTLSGKTIQLKDYKGKYVLLDFWASWCPQCKAAMPEMAALYKTYHEKYDLEIIGMSLDTNLDDLNAYLKENTVPWEHIVIGGFDHPLIKDYSIIAIPSEILIGPDGKVVKKGFKGEHGIEEYLKTKFKP